MWLYVFQCNEYILAGSYGSSVLTIQKAVGLFSEARIIFFTILPGIYEIPNFFISLPTLVTICLFNYSRAGGCEGVSHCGLDAFS